jgi:hypothetical protein
MYEARHQKPLAPALFQRRLAWHMSGAGLLLAVSLLLGMIGYHALEHLAWTDAFLNSAMLLGGMGPVDKPVTPDGKLFAGIFALYAGLVFLIAAALVLAPILHRLLHRFHWDDKD